MDGVHIGIFLKEPRPGRVKTRLAKAIGVEAAAAVYTAMLGDTVTLARQAQAASELYFYEGASPAGYLGRALAGESLLFEQPAGDLGERLEAAVAAAERADRLPLLLLGSDSPDLPPAYLLAAIEALERNEIVLGPSEDGGVWCIGLRLAVAGFFDDLPWSSEETLDALRRRTREHRLSLAELPRWSDVDEFVDLLALEARISENPDRAPQCYAWLGENGQLLNNS